MSKENAERLFQSECHPATFRASLGVTTNLASGEWSVRLYPRKLVTTSSNYKFIWIVRHGKAVVDGGVARSKRFEAACMFAVMKLHAIKGSKR